MFFDSSLVSDQTLLIITVIMTLVSMFVFIFQAHKKHGKMDYENLPFFLLYMEMLYITIWIWHIMIPIIALCLLLFAIWKLFIRISRALLMIAPKEK